MKKIIKRAAALAIAAALTTGAAPPRFGGGFLQKPANVYAADAYTFDESTGVLSLKGLINLNVRSEILNYKDKSKVKKVVAEEGTKITQGSFLFDSFVNCTEMDLSKADVSSCERFGAMFNNCTSLKKLDLLGWDTGSAVNMQQMFDSCKSLEELDLSSFTIKSGTDFQSAMFYGCSSLKKLTLGKGCSGLTSDSRLQQGEFGWSNVMAPDTIISGTDTYAVISNSGKNTYIRDYALMPATDCYTYNSTTGLLTLKNVVDRETIRRFEKKTSVKKIAAQEGTKFVDSCSCMFDGYTNCTDIDLSNVDTSRMTSMSNMFYGCYSLINLDLTGVDTSKVDSMDYTFGICSALENIDLSGFDTTNVTTMEYMFYGCQSLKKIDLGKFSFEKVMTMAGMFGGCEALESISGTAFASSDCTDLASMFSGCTALKELDLRSLDTVNAENMNSFFAGCESLSKLYLSSKFGDVVAAHRLPNGGGWLNGKGDKISGSGEFAEISKTTSGSAAYYKRNLIKAENYNLKYLTFPTPGTTAWDSLSDLKAMSNEYTVDMSNTYWIDAVTGKKLSGDDVFVYGGAYLLSVRLRPNENYVFAEPTEDALAYTDIYGFDGKTVFCEAEKNTARLLEDGSLEFLAYISNYRKSSAFYSYEAPDGRKAAAHYLNDLGVSAPDAHTVLIKDMYNALWQEPTVAPTYYYSLDQENWYTFAEINGVGIGKLRSDTEYTVYVLVKGERKPFYTKTVKTPASEEAEPIYRVDITDVVAPNAPELPVKTATVSGEGAVLCTDSDIADYGTDGMNWADDDVSGDVMPPGAKFLAGNKYTVRVLVSAEDGYVFPDDLTDITATVNGKPAGIQPMEDGKSIIVTYQFTATGTNKITVSFAPDGGSGTMEDASVTAFAEFALPECGFTAPEGKEFAGWFINGEIRQAGEKITVTEDITLYAMWDYSIVSVKFDANGGDGSIADSVLLSGCTFAFPSCSFTAPDGKVFAGWQIGDKTYNAGDTLKITADTVVKALWSEEVKEKLLVGDVDGDGSVTTLDAELIARYVNGWEGIEIDLDAADLDRDGTVDVRDSIILSRAVAAWDGYDTYIAEIEK
ncbi:BspA family leucine-rich repeat surface protein [Ruminococcus flavefaciens]|uniref:BspA family leucine-rich repeat surface protein n=1 Tax=Ruminococcus flavefaciens TaxID=1265 RepID=UPI00048AEB9D|nr:BspA family leucine-rich repeat surface protein [Ruminococcus flavefaciens]